MPVSPASWNDVFADMGKIVKVYNILDDQGPIVETAIVEMVEQMDRNYANVEILASIISNATTARNGMSSGATNMITAMNTYLLGPLKDEMQSTATTAATMLDDVITQMTTDVESLLTAGVGYTFYFDVYAKALPTDAAPTIADSLFT